MQLRFKTALSCQDYVKEQAWQRVTLSHCPLHPSGGCGFARHGTYGRVEPPGTRVPRWYCPEGHCTFSLLADCFACRLPGSLTDLEQVVVVVEKAKSLEAAADRLRTDDISLPGAIRWTRRRIQQVHIALRMLLELIPESLRGCKPTVTAFRHWLNVEWVLPQLRELASMDLDRLPPPLGFAPRPLRSVAHPGHIQHDMGPDPPPRDRLVSLPWPCLRP